MQQRLDGGKMKTFEVVLNKSINSLEFGVDRKTVRKEFGRKYKEIKKNVFSKSTTDAYDGFHVFYSEDDKLEAIEIFSGKVLIEGKEIFPGTIDEAKNLIKGLKKSDYGYISKDKSVGITESDLKDGKIEAILLGCEGYYG